MHAAGLYTREERKALSDLWRDTEAPAPVLLVAFIDQYGIRHKDQEEPIEALEWSPETIAQEIHDDLGVRPAPTCVARLMAAIQLCTSNTFYQDPSAFIDLAVTLTTGTVSPGVWIPANAAECALAITWAILLSPPESSDSEPFSDDIRAYLGKVLQQEGILTPPDVLRIATHDADAMNQVRYSYADDPEMFNGIWGAEQEKTGEINRFVKENLRDALKRIEALPLRHGNAANLARGLLDKLEGMDKSAT